MNLNKALIKMLRLAVYILKKQLFINNLMINLN